LGIELTASSCGIVVDRPTWDLGGQPSKAFRKSDRVKSEKSDYDPDSYFEYGSVG